jgi:8-oxo-dGTP pyrophosphatase MutT (NUDIX family)
LREAHEEIGLPPEDVDVVGALAPVGTFVTNYAIYPFVGLIEPGTEWVPQAREVAEVLEFPLAEVRAAHGSKRLVRKGVPFRTDTYEIGNAMIWGATARIVADLLRRI